MKRTWISLALPLLIPAVLLMACEGAPTQTPTGEEVIPVTAGGTLEPVVYLPLLTNRYNPLAASRTVNAYYANVADMPADKMHEMSIVWFGKVTNSENYADVRVGYNNTHLYVRVGIVDRYLQYDSAETGQNMEQYDAFTLLLSRDGAGASAPTAQSYRLVVEFSGNTSNPMFQAYTGNGSGWVVNSGLRQAVDVKTSYRGDDLVKNINIRGWSTQYEIPFSSLGLSGKPADGAFWKLAMILHDRDSLSASPLPVKLWTEAAERDIPATWGNLRFGVPEYVPPIVTNMRTTNIRDEVNGVEVPDADVGGSGLCGDMVDWRTDWALWGNYNQGFEGDLNVSNEAQMEHWPCYSKYYVSFPLGSIPPGKGILSATLKLYQFGGAGLDQTNDTVYDSLIQVLTVGETWDEGSITWNNAPMAVENFSRAWVKVAETDVCPGIERTWDVSRAVAQAYELGKPANLVLYSSEAPQHTGKYFYSSDTGCGKDARPVLEIKWGDP